MPLRLLAIILSALVALGLQAPATASTGGTPAGSEHPNVGILFGYSEGVRYRCSGTLVSPTVILTAGHCTDGADGKVLVDFTSFIAEEPADFNLPPASDVSAGYTSEEIAAAGHRSGTASTYPAYAGLTDLRNWNDVGVVVLDQPAEGIEPATIAPVGTLDGIKKSALAKTLFRAVGYGTELRKPESGPQKLVAESFPLLRRYVEMPGQKLTPQVLQTNGNPNDNRGTGGTCTGDSGGPVFYNGEIVAVTSYGINDKCRGISGSQRVDITGVQDWLSEFGL